MHYQVTGNRVVVVPDPKEKEVAGLLLPESVAAQPVTGTIKQVGPLVDFYRPGMRIVFPERAGILTAIGEERIRILDPESEILAILSESEVADAAPV